MSGVGVNVIDAFRFFVSLGTGSGLTPQTCFCNFKLVTCDLKINNAMYMPLFSSAATLDLRLGAEVVAAVSILSYNVTLL